MSVDKMEPFTFASSSDLHLPVSVKINTLDGTQRAVPFSKLIKDPILRYTGSNTSPNFEFFVTARVWADSKPLTIPMQTSYKPFKNSKLWNEWLKLPISYSDIPLNAQVALTVWDLSPVATPQSCFNAIPFGGTTIPLFSKDGTLMKGRQRCYLHRNKPADGGSDTRTPHILPRRIHRHNGKIVEEQKDARIAEIERLEGLIKKHEMGEIPENTWLDRLVFRQIEKLQRGASQAKLESPMPDPGPEDGEQSDALPKEPVNEDDGVFYLYIDFPRFDHPVVFTDVEYPAPPITTMLNASTSDLRLKPPPEVSLGPGINDPDDKLDDPSVGRLIQIYDPEVGIRENPAETKHRRLIRNQKTGVLDREMKPNALIRDNLNLVMSYGPLQELKVDEKDMIWKFRHYLTRDKKALTKFVKSVTWSDPQEARVAVQMLPRWTEIDVDDALELLGPTFEYPAVRAYAVDRLRKSSDDELLLYLLQLVQALKFEPIVANGSAVDAEQDSSLARFLITRAANNFMLGNYLHWYLMVECDDERTGQGSTDTRQLFAKVEYDFMLELSNVTGGAQYRKTLLRQGELITLLSKAARDIRTSREERPKKIEFLKRFMADAKNELMVIDSPLPLPLDPSVMICGCIPEESNVFKSSLLPILVTWKTVSGQKYPMIFKAGDDLRQDQLVVQIIALMDRLLRNENLDLKLSPYKILATAPYAGAVQFVSSTPLAAIITKYRTIHAYLRHHNPDASAPLGVRKEAMETYVKSCAGYCVMTYILGVGDRHLDNLLLAPSGHFFHADFGYILGRDPKPLAPQMKLTREMVEGMGGAQHPYYASFKQYCYTAYTTLRKSSNLILNLFALMSEANIPDIRLEPDKAVLKVQERFHLELTEDEAIRGFEQLIQDSISAVMPVVIDRLHGLVQGWRA